MKKTVSILTVGCCLAAQSFSAQLMDMLAWPPFKQRDHFHFVVYPFSYSVMVSILCLCCTCTWCKAVFLSCGLYACMSCREGAKSNWWDFDWRWNCQLYILRPDIFMSREARLSACSSQRLSGSQPCAVWGFCWLQLHVLIRVVPLHVHTYIIKPLFPFACLWPVCEKWPAV